MFSLYNVMIHRFHLNFSANFVSLLLGSPNRGPQMEALPPLDPASQQLCYTTLTCLAHYLCWVPLSTVVRPQLLSTIFHFAAFGCQSRPDGNESSPSSRSTSFSSSTHKLGEWNVWRWNNDSHWCYKRDFIFRSFKSMFPFYRRVSWLIGKVLGLRVWGVSGLCGAQDF